MSYGLKDVSLVCILYLTDEKDGQTEDFVIRIFNRKTEMGLSLGFGILSALNSPQKSYPKMRRTIKESLELTIYTRLEVLEKDRPILFLDCKHLDVLI